MTDKPDVNLTEPQKCNWKCKINIIFYLLINEINNIITFLKYIDNIIYFRNIFKILDSVYACMYTMHNSISKLVFHLEYSLQSNTVGFTVIVQSHFWC